VQYGWGVSRHFLADRTNGRAYATVLRPSSVVIVICDVMYCGKTDASYRANVTINSLLEVVYEKPIGAKMNDLNLSLKVI